MVYFFPETKGLELEDGDHLSLRGRGSHWRRFLHPGAIPSVQGSIGVRTRRELRSLLRLVPMCECYLFMVSCSICRLYRLFNETQSKSYCNKVNQHITASRAEHSNTIHVAATVPKQSRGCVFIDSWIECRITNATGDSLVLTNQGKSTLFSPNAELNANI